MTESLARETREDGRAAGEPSGDVRLLFLATEGFPATVYSSQVADLLRVLDGAGLRFDVLNFDPLYPRTLLTPGGRARAAALRSALPGGLRVRPWVPFEDRVGTPLARRLLRLELRGRIPTVIHARGVWAASLAARLAQRRPWLRFVYDARGDYLAEHAHHVSGRGEDASLRTRLGRWRIGRAEVRACRSASRILAVSEALRDVLEERCPGAALKTTVIPSGFDPAKFSLDPALRKGWRDRLGLGERFVVVYTGSMASWQQPEATFRIGARACELRPDAHLLVVTPEVERARVILARVGIPTERVTCQAAPHEDMPGLLNAADLGLLIRRRDPVNRVASPTKLAEYLACGLPVLMSDAIADASALVQTEGLGAVLPDFEDQAAAGATLSELLEQLPSREHVAAVARERLARDRFLPVYRELYAGMIEAAREGLG